MVGKNLNGVGRTLEDLSRLGDLTPFGGEGNYRLVTRKNKIVVTYSLGKDGKYYRVKVGSKIRRALQERERSLERQPYFVRV